MRWTRQSGFDEALGHSKCLFAVLCGGYLRLYRANKDMKAYFIYRGESVSVFELWETK